MSELVDQTFEGTKSNLDQAFDGCLNAVYFANSLYKIVETQHFDYPPNDALGFEDIDPEENKVFLGTETHIYVYFNSYTDVVLYRKSLVPFIEKYKQSVFDFINDINFTLQEGTEYLIDHLRIVNDVKAKVYKKTYADNTYTRSVSISSLDSDDMERINNELSEYVYGTKIYAELNKFTTVQYDFLTHVSDILNFSSGINATLIQEDSRKDNDKKLKINLSKIDIIVLLKALRDSEIIQGSDKELGKFAFENLLYQNIDAGVKTYKEMQDVYKTLNAIQNQDRIVDTNLLCLKDQLSKLKLRKKSK